MLAHACMLVAAYNLAAGNLANSTEVPPTRLLAQGFHFLEFILCLPSLTCKMLCELYCSVEANDDNNLLIY